MQPERRPKPGETLCEAESECPPCSVVYVKLLWWVECLFDRILLVDTSWPCGVLCFFAFCESCAQFSQCERGGTNECEELKKKDSPCSRGKNPIEKAHNWKAHAATQASTPVWAQTLQPSRSGGHHAMWRSLLLRAALLLSPHAAAAGPRIYSLTPSGGPVLGDTAITVVGHDLENIECVFALPSTYIRDRPPSVGAICQYNAQADDAGFRCVCVAPPAPRLARLQDVLDEETGATTQAYVAVSDYLPVGVTVKPLSSRKADFAPFDTIFNYYDLNRLVNVTSVEPSAGHPELDTLVTVRGNGFVDHSGGEGVYCSFPGPNWDAFLSPSSPEFPWEDFTTKATLLDSSSLLCTIPPMGNNSDPVFIEVCLSGHPDRASTFGRVRRDDFCTSSLVRFDYIDQVKTNLTLWNTSVIAGPVAGGTAIRMFGKYGFTNFLTLAPDVDGLPDHGRPTCVFGKGLGRGVPRPPTEYVTSPATLLGAKPLRYHLITNDFVKGDNSTVSASIGRRNMCLPDEAQYNGDARTLCSCKFALALAPITPPCGCGCRDLLKRNLPDSDFDMCVNRAPLALQDTEPDIQCGPLASAYHRRLAAVPALSATCHTPPYAKAGVVEVEFAPGGEARSTSNSKAQAVDFRYYDAAFGSVSPLAAPLEGGSRFVVQGNNLAAFATGTRTGAFNIYGVPSQVREYDATPRCFIGSRAAAVGAELLDCETLIDGWMQGSGTPASGCQRIRCFPAPPTTTSGASLPLMVSLNGQYDSATAVAQLSTFDNDAVSISLMTPSAGPLAGGVRIELSGAGFVDLGGATCILSVSNSFQIELPATITSASLAACTPQSIHAAGIGAKAVSVGIVLNGDLATARFAASQAARTFYFVDLNAVRIDAVHPPAGPIRGGTTILLRGSGFTACGGSVCPQPPMCLFDLPGYSLPGPAAAAAAAAANQPLPGSEPRTVTVTGTVKQRLGAYTLHCDAPPPGVTTEDATEVPLPASALSTKIRIAFLGYLARPGEPSMMLSAVPTFRYYDAAVHTAHPSGGPPDGGTSVTLGGRALLGSFVPPTQYFPDGGSPALDKSPRCVFLGSPPPPFGATAEVVAAYRASRVATAEATVTPNGGLRCKAPKLTALATSGVSRLFIEASLNGYVDEHTSLTVSKPPIFTYYAARVERIEPMGGPSAGGTTLTLHGVNLGDHGGPLCKFGFGSGAGSLQVLTNASVFSGNGVGGGAVRCMSPAVHASHLQALGGGLPSATSVELSLNGDVTQTAQAAACAPTAMSGHALLSDVAATAALNVSEAAGRRARCYAYFAPENVTLTSVFPRGGPHSGGTTLTVRGSGFHTFGSLGCILGTLPAVPATRVSDGELRCRTSPNGPLPSTGRLPVRITLNGIDIMPSPMRTAAGSSSGTTASAAVSAMGATTATDHVSISRANSPALSYTYYNAAFIKPETLVPDRGGALGGTLIVVFGRGFADFGGLLCRFGGDAVRPGDPAQGTASAANVTWSAAVNGTLRSDGTVLCRSPPYLFVNASVGNTSVLPAPVALHVLLNGQADQPPLGEPARFTFEAEKEATARIVAVPPLPLSVQRAQAWRGEDDSDLSPDLQTGLTPERLKPLDGAAQFADDVGAGQAGAHSGPAPPAGAQVRADPSRYTAESVHSSASGTAAAVGLS